jgi:hypothetical protein
MSPPPPRVARRGALSGENPMTHSLDFAILYACVLALFSYLAFWFVPIAVRVLYVAAKSLLKPERSQRDRLGSMTIS